MATFVFLYFAAVIVTAASLVVLLRNPIYSALSLLVMFFHVAGLSKHLSLIHISEPTRPY